MMRRITPWSSGEGGEQRKASAGGKQLLADEP